MLEQEREYHVARAAEHTVKIEELDAKLAAMEGMQGNDVDGESERSNKRRRTWFWGAVGWIGECKTLVFSVNNIEQEPLNPPSTLI